MGNCLVTKLKGVVSNDSLPILGCSVIPLEPYSGATPNRVSVWGSANEPFYVEIKGSGHFYDVTGATDYGQHLDAVVDTTPELGTVYAINAFYLNNVAEGDTLIISNKYSIQWFLLSYTANRIIKTDSNPDFYYFTDLKVFNPYNNTVFHLDMEALCRNSKSLTYYYNPYNKLAYGAIEKMVENMIKAGRTSGTFDLGAYASQITLQGTNFFTSYEDRSQYLSIDFSGNTATLTWKGRQIASYNGSTWTYNS